jgi:hypothetical protein
MFILRLGHMCHIEQGLHVGHKIDSHGTAVVREPTNVGPFNHIVFIEHFYLLQLQEKYNCLIRIVMKINYTVIVAAHTLR